MIQINDALRIKVVRSCNLKCSFCHEEGCDKSSIITLQQVDDVLSFAQEFGYTKFHLTGGEPTLHPNLKAIVQKITDLGYPCGLTSNGQFDGKTLEDLKDASLTSINISLHTVDAVEWAKVQEDEDLAKAQNQIDRALENILKALELGIRTKVNIVVSENYETAIAVIERLAGTGAEIRLLNQLDSNASLIGISSILEHYEACEVDEVKIMGSSQTKTMYTSRIGRFVVKTIAQHRDSTICTGCKENCMEGFYGIRVIPFIDDIQARLCVQVTNSRTMQALDSFRTSPQFRSIRRTGGLVTAEETQTWKAAIALSS